MDKILTGEVIRLDRHPTDEQVTCMRCDPKVITVIRSMPGAPSTWYSPSDTAYLIKASDLTRLTHGLTLLGASISGNATPPVERHPRGDRPLWCGECDERTRLAVVDADPLTLTRCPVCHPLRDQPLPGMTGRRGHDHTPAVDPEEYHRGLGTVRAELDRLRLGRTREIRPGEPVLIGQLLEEGDDEAHPF